MSVAQISNSILKHYHALCKSASLFSLLKEKALIVKLFGIREHLAWFLLCWSCCQTKAYKRSIFWIIKLDDLDERIEQESQYNRILLVSFCVNSWTQNSISQRLLGTSSLRFAWVSMVLHSSQFIIYPICTISTPFHNCPCYRRLSVSPFSIVILWLRKLKYK